MFGYVMYDGRYNTLSLVGQEAVQIDKWIDLDFEEYTTAQIDIISFTYNDSGRCTFGINWCFK